MKYFNLLAFLCIVAVAVSCKKTPKPLDITQIVQTDINGNVINDNGLNHWTWMDKGCSDVFSTLEHVIFTTNNMPGPIVHCPPDDSIKIVVYPNPMIRGTMQYLKIESNIRIVDFAVSATRLGDIVHGNEGGVNPTILSPDGKLLLVRVDNLTLVPRDVDLELFICIATEDGCFRFSYGKLMAPL